jgi:hypothetical protein
MQTDNIYSQCTSRDEPLYNISQRRLIKAAIANSTHKKTMELIDVILQGYDLREVINAFLFDRYNFTESLKEKFESWQ